MLGAALLPGLVILPISAVLMVVIAAHLIVAAQKVEPASRRRIRLANGAVMLVTIPLLASGFSIIDPDIRPTEWLLVWMGVIALLAIAVSLALLDIANTARLTYRTRQRLRESMREMRREARAARRRAREGGAGADD